MMGHWRRGKSGFEEFTTGLVMAVGFTVAALVTKIYYFLIPAGFAGLIPMLSGLRKMISNASLPKKNREQESRQLKADLERKILQVAKNNDGIVTPTVAALETGLPLEEMDSFLGSMASRGYARADVEDSGRMIYVFQDFVKQVKD